MYKWKPIELVVDYWGLPEKLRDVRDTSILATHSEIRFKSTNRE